MWQNLIIVITLVILSGTFAGLTLALFGIRLTTLERKVRLGDPRALKVYKIRKQGNLLLCTLLLGNVASYTIMAIFLGSITSGVIAGFVATALIFIFGEILPQAVFPRYALQIGSKLSWLVWILIVIFYPVAAPIAWLLDKLLGQEPPVLWNKDELREIIRYHEDVGDGIIDQDEERIILGALSFSDLKVSDILIPREHVFYLHPDTLVTPELLDKIRRKGFSRVPVVAPMPDQVTGILYLKELIGQPQGKPVSELCSKRNILSVSESMRLDELLNLLVHQKMHMAIVVDKNKYFKGVATLEDIMEEILKIELEDLKY